MAAQEALVRYTKIPPVPAYCQMQPSPAPMMTSMMTDLYKGVTVGVLRSGFKGVAAACKKSGIHPNDLLDHWKVHVDGFADFLDRHRFDRFSIMYCDKFRPGFLDAMTCTDKTRVCDMFHYTRFERDHADIAQHEDKFASMVVLAIACHCSKTCGALRSATADKYCLWPAFKDAFPASAESWMAENSSCANVPAKRKHPMRNADFSIDTKKKCRAKSQHDAMCDRLDGVQAQLGELVGLTSSLLSKVDHASSSDA
jgi:hypothetical protein